MDLVKKPTTSPPALLKFLSAEEKYMDKWYCKNNSFIYYSLGEENIKQNGGAHGGMYLIRKKNKVAPKPLLLNELTPVVPMTQPDKVCLPHDMIESIVGTVITNANNDIARTGLNETITVSEVHRIIVRTLNTLSASKLLRKSMIDQLKAIREENNKAYEIRNELLENLTLKINTNLAEVLVAIQQYNPVIPDVPKLRQSLKIMRDFLLKFNLTSADIDKLEYHLINNLKDWNFDSHSVMIENIIRSHIDSFPNKPAGILLPYGDTINGLKKIFECMLEIMLNVPHQRSTCSLALLDLEGTKGIRIVFEYQKIKLIPIGLSSRDEVIKTHPYCINQVQVTDIRNWFQEQIIIMIKQMPLLKFVDLTISVHDIDTIIVDLDDVVNNSPQSYFISRAEQSIEPGIRRLLLLGPLKYLAAKVYREIYRDICDSHRRDKAKITSMITEIRKCQRDMKISLSGGKKYKKNK